MRRKRLSKQDLALFFPKEACLAGDLEGLSEREFIKMAWQEAKDIFDSVFPEEQRTGRFPLERRLRVAHFVVSNKKMFLFKTVWPNASKAETAATARLKSTKPFPGPSEPNPTESLLAPPAA